MKRRRHWTAARQAPATCLVLLCMAACGPGGPATPPPTAVPVAVSDAPPSADDEGAEPTSKRSWPATCGTAGLSLDDYAWIPSDARGAVSIVVAAPETSAALAALAAHGRQPEHGLPITVAFAVTQWPIVVPVLGSLLDSVGLQPDEWVYVAPATGPAFAWVVRSDCDLDEALARIEESWGLVGRRRVEGVVASTPPAAGAGDGTLHDPPKAGQAPAEPSPDAPTFPYDVVFASGGRVALVPQGHGDAFLTMLNEASPTNGWARSFDALAPAPVRGVLSGRSLVGSKNRHPSATTLRALPEAVHVDVMVEASASP